MPNDVGLRGLFLPVEGVEAGSLLALRELRWALLR